MRILIDIGHPAHVHYFKHFAWIMQSKGHVIKVVARDKEMTFQLLEHYGFKYDSRGKGGKGIIGKLIYLFKGDWILYKITLSFKPDVVLSFASSYAAHASWLYGSPHVALDDTEHSKLELLLYPPFTKYILTPSFFTLSLGKKHIRFHAFMEQFYLNHEVFKPDVSVLELLNVKQNESFAIVRFVSWGASHDTGVERLNENAKLRIVQYISSKIKVFISSEDVLPMELRPLELDIPKHMIHDALHFAKIYIGEGATTASESVLLSTPAVYINSLTAGTLEREKSVGLLKQCTSLEDTLKSIDTFLEEDEDSIRKKHDYLLAETINPTNYLVNFIETLGQVAKG